MGLALSLNLGSFSSVYMLVLEVCTTTPGCVFLVLPKTHETIYPSSHY